MANLSLTKSQIDAALQRSHNSGLVVLLYSDDAFSGEFLDVATEGVLKTWTTPETSYQFSKFIIESEVRAKHINVEGAEIDYVFKIKFRGDTAQSITPIISNENVGNFIGGVYIFPLKCVVDNAEPSEPSIIDITGFYSLEGGQVAAHSLRVYGVLN
jgi:hypothetical protein